MDSADLDPLTRRDDMRPRHQSGQAGQAWTGASSWASSWTAEKPGQRHWTGTGDNSHHQSGDHSRRATARATEPKPAVPAAVVPTVTDTCVDIHWVQTAQEYCQTTSLHGLRYVGDAENSAVERCFWIVSFTAAVIVAAYFITNIYQRWENSPVINSIAPAATPIFEIPFPAVTICNMNKARRSVVEGILNSSADTPDNTLKRCMLSDLCNDPENPMPCNMEDLGNTTADWNYVMSFMINVSQPCHEMLVQCTWHNQNVPCDDAFNPTLTDDGICCTFNRVKRDLIFRNPKDLSDLNVTFPYSSVDWTPETGYPANSTADLVPWRPWGSGSHLGLSIILDAEIYDYYCSSTSSMGFKLILHNPVETPKIASFGSFIQPGTESRVSIHPVISHTSSVLQAVSQDKRQCVFQSERQLSFYRTYTQRNCVLECEANFTLKHCKCVSYYMPKDKNTRICGKKDEKCAEVAREAMELRSANAAANLTHLNISDSDIAIGEQCQCLPGCSELTYTFTKTSTPYSPTYRPKLESYLYRDAEYLRKNMATINLYFTETLFKSTRKSELFGFTEFLSNTGGILGLFLGFSFLSVVEILYFLSLRLYCSWSRAHPTVPTTHTTKVKLKYDNNHVAVIEPFPYLQ